MKQAFTALQSHARHSGGLALTMHRPPGINKDINNAQPLPSRSHHPVREEEKYRTDEQIRDIDGGGTEREQERGGKRELELR